VRLRVEGSVDAFSEFGELFVHLRGSSLAVSARLETLTGPITIQLPRGAKFAATVATRGDITTDFSIAIDKQPGQELKRGRIEHGSDGAAIELISNRGPIRLHESEVAAADAPVVKGAAVL
jgi:hypothetical protein